MKDLTDEHILQYLNEPMEFLQKVLKNNMSFAKVNLCAFHFIEIQSAFCLFLQNGLEFFN